MGERVLVNVQKATGVRWDTCPWQALRDPLVSQVFRAYPHWKLGELGAFYGGNENVPAVLLEALAVYESAVNRVQSYDAEVRRKQREQDNERAAAQAQLGGSFARSAPRARR
jgi:hypothetical protein